MERDIAPGQTFGNLTAVSYAGVVNNYRSWVFRCTCGVQKVFAASLVRNGRQRSCGCARLKQKQGFKSNRLALIKARKQATTPKELATRMEILASVFRAVPKAL